ncbi:KptA family-domain-containing protein [Kalaharituber pfeilii]|nr:KptA family-domain-containing protein [Kalaharituber pfeilii]
MLGGRMPKPSHAHYECMSQVVHPVPVPPRTLNTSQLDNFFVTLLILSAHPVERYKSRQAAPFRFLFNAFSRKQQTQLTSPPGAQRYYHSSTAALLHNFRAQGGQVMPRGANRRDRSGRGGGRGGAGNDDVTLSRALSLTLRHAAIKEGLDIRPDGYARVSDLLAMPKFTRLNLDFETLQRLVRESDKQRFALACVDENGEPVPIPLKPKSTTTTTSSSSSTTAEIVTTTTDSVSTTSTLTTTTSTLTLSSFTPLPHGPTKYFIRATQAHPHHPSNLPALCVHGTFYAFFQPILDSGGLKTMGRTHIHFARGLPEGFHSDSSSGISKVISGLRTDAQLLFYIDLPAALAAGIPFWESENEVILSEGDPKQGGLLGMEFVEKVVDVGSAHLGMMWQRGQGLLKELPAKLKGRAPRGKEKVMQQINAGRKSGQAAEVDESVV